MIQGEFFFFPDKAYCIQTNHLDTIFYVGQNNAQHFQQQFRVGKIQINLITAKGAPHVFFALGGFKNLA
ncbi:MAG: hypothetical protein HC848_06960 [Limnobacter sp.]|nr:hypothetical protein [Limnobacter sp.]